MRISRRCRCSRLLCVGFVLSLTVLVVHLVSISDQLDHSLSGKEGNHRKEAYQRIKPNATVSPIDKLLSKLHVTGLEDIYFAVKTTQAYHRKRLQVLLDTWVSLVKKQTYFFTDGEDSEFSQKTDGHLINTFCKTGHERWMLVCKMNKEYDAFLASGKRWFCHVDDDTYVNVIALASLLNRYDPKQDWYLGKQSTTLPMTVLNRMASPPAKYSFIFGTGGAGFCLSKSLALKMTPYASNGGLIRLDQKMHLPDDCIIGFIIAYYLNTTLTNIKDMHSHLESLSLHVTHHNIHEKITFSYKEGPEHGGDGNIADVGGFSLAEDPTRFKSAHCTLFKLGCPGHR